MFLSAGKKTLFRLPRSNTRESDSLIYSFIRWNLEETRLDEICTATRQESHVGDWFNALRLLNDSFLLSADLKLIQYLIATITMIVLGKVDAVQNMRSLPVLTRFGPMTCCMSWVLIGAV